jgi:hypothetical protein
MHFVLPAPVASLNAYLAHSSSSGRIPSASVSLGNARARIKGDIGAGALVYEGAQGVDFPEMSIWEFQLFGGLRTSGDLHEPEAAMRVVGGLTASHRVLQMLDNRLSSDSPSSA